MIPKQLHSRVSIRAYLRKVRDPVVGGSNPLAPTNQSDKLRTWMAAVRGARSRSHMRSVATPTASVQISNKIGWITVGGGVTEFTISHGRQRA
jgi:hypothetical protein